MSSNPESQNLKYAFIKKDKAGRLIISKKAILSTFSSIRASPTEVISKVAS
jgi:hypothetical protein